MNPSRTDLLSSFLRAHVKTHSSVNRAQEIAFTLWLHDVCNRVQLLCLLYVRVLQKFSRFVGEK